MRTKRLILIVILFCDERWRLIVVSSARGKQVICLCVFVPHSAIRRGSIIIDLLSNWPRVVCHSEVFEALGCDITNRSVRS